MGAPKPRCERITNNGRMSLSMAVWLADDDYDYEEEIPNYLSVTTLIKSVRQIILGSRVPQTEKVYDVSERITSRMGHAIHSSVERTWKERYMQCLSILGYPKVVINRIRINPKPEELFPGVIPIYLEQRSYCKIGNYTVGGKYDFVGDGTLEDIKTTVVWTYMNGINDWKYQLQGSLYRWLNPEVITTDYMNIQFIFKDWSKLEAATKASNGYPQTNPYTHKIKLMSLAETELWVQRKIALIDKYKDAPEAELPLCDARDMWQEPPTYKYYKNPQSTKRSTKNFATMAEAQIRFIEDGSVGMIVESPGLAKGCHPRYCAAFQYCSQKDALMQKGAIKL